MSYSFATPWIVARQVPLFMGFLRKEYWSGFPFPSPENYLHPGIESSSPAWQVDYLSLGTWEAHNYMIKLPNLKKNKWSSLLVNSVRLSFLLTKTYLKSQINVHGAFTHLWIYTEQ